MKEPSQNTDEIIHKLIVARETIPHSRRWEAARKAMLFRYLRRRRKGMPAGGSGAPDGERRG